MKVLRLMLYKSIENIIIITLYIFRLNSVFTADTCFGYILPLMFFIFDVPEEWTWNISNNYIIKGALMQIWKSPYMFVFM